MRQVYPSSPLSQVYPSIPNTASTPSSTGNGLYMLIRQFQFPDSYNERDRHFMTDRDRLFYRNKKRASSRCFKEYTGTGELDLEKWVRRATDIEVMAFLRAMLDPRRLHDWTGYRIMCTAHRGNGYPVWTLELFAKHSSSQTRVYTGQNNREDCVEVPHSREVLV